LNDEITLREIRPADDPVIAAIVRQSLKDFNANKAGTVFFDPTTDHISGLFKEDRSRYFIIEVNGEIAGGGGVFPTAGLPTDTCELVKMYLSSKFRGKGLGKMLLNKCMETAKELGYSKMYLETLHELTKAIPLYEKTGFKFISHPLGHSGHNGCDLWMTRDL